MFAKLFQYIYTMRWRWYQCSWLHRTFPAKHAWTQALEQASGWAGEGVPETKPVALSSAELESASSWRELPKLAREVWLCHFWNIHWGLKPTGVDEWDWVAAVTFILFQTFDINYSPEYWTCLHFLARWRAIWLGQSANMCSVAIWHKKTSFNCYSWHSSSRAGGLALMHSLSVVPLPTLLMLPRNCASLCPTSVVSIYRLLSASTERGCVCTVLRVTKELNHHHGQYHKNWRQTTLSSPPHRTDRI